MKAFAIAALAATALTLSACGENLGKGQPLNVVSGHIVMGATDDRPAVGYFRVQGGPQPVELVAVTADLAQRVEVIKRRDAFDRDPEGFAATWADADHDTRKHVEYVCRRGDHRDVHDDELSCPTRRSPDLPLQWAQARGR